MTLADVLAANQSHEASAMAQCDGLIYLDLPSTETTLTDLMIFIFLVHHLNTDSISLFCKSLLN